MEKEIAFNGKLRGMKSRKPHPGSSSRTTPEECEGRGRKQSWSDYWDLSSPSPDILDITRPSAPSAYSTNELVRPNTDLELRSRDYAVDPWMKEDKQVYDLPQASQSSMLILSESVSRGIDGS